MKQAHTIVFFIILSFSLVHAPAFCAEVNPDYVNHPLYSTYLFGGKGDKVLDLGTQPMAVPEGLIGAALGHDRLLRQALKERGWELRSHSFLKGLDSNFFFQQANLDVALAGIWPTLTLASLYDIQVIGLAEQGYVSLITKGRLRQITDLKGMRIGAPSGSTAHHSLLVAIETAGMQESDVTIIPLEVSEMSEALKQGRVDAFSSWEPFSANALRTHPELSVVQRFLTYDYIYLSAKWAKQHPEIADLVTAAYIRSLHWMTDDRKNLMRAIAWAIKDSTKILGKPPTFSPEEMAGIASSSLPMIAASPMVPRQDLTEKGYIRRAFTFFQKKDKIAATVPWNKIERSFDTTLIERVLADPGNHQFFSSDYDE